MRSKALKRIFCLKGHLQALDVYWMYNWWHSRPCTVSFLRETWKPVSRYRVLLHEAHGHLYIYFIKETRSSNQNEFFSVIYSRKTTQNYDYKTTICGKLYDHTYFLKEKTLPFQVSRGKRVSLDGLKIIAGIFPGSFLWSFWLNVDTILKW